MTWAGLSGTGTEVDQDGWLSTLFVQSIVGKFFKSLSLCVIINKMVTIIGTYKAVITHSKSLDITIITNMYLNSFYSPPNRLSSLKRMILSLLFLYP